MPKKISHAELLQREALIIETACALIGQSGFSNLTMDKVVESVPYSKGSVYKLFNSVEEILLAITNDGATLLLDFMQRAHGYDGNSRERNLARAFAYHLYGQLYPIQFFCELQAISPTVREKASEKRLARGAAILNQFKTLAQSFVQDAIDCGDLVCPHAQSPSRIANCSWSAEFGVTSYALATSAKQTDIGIAAREKLEQDIFYLANTYMDGLNWHPHSAKVDYQEAWQQIKFELFAEEVARLGQ